MAEGVFITGTDTGVGKTVVSAAIIAALRGLGVQSSYIKPVATGCVGLEGKLVSPDALFVKTAAGLEDPPEAMSCVCLREPLSPLAAAAIEKKRYSLGGVRYFIRRSLETRPFTVVEGIGGVMVPLTARSTVLDMIDSLGLKVIVVARPGLGTINHTLMTINALRQRRLKITGFIFCAADPQWPLDPSTQHNASIIKRFSGRHFLGTLRWMEGGGGGEELRRAALSDIDIRTILRAAAPRLESGLKSRLS